MPRILSSVVGRISKRNVQPVSYNDRLIITDYDDAESVICCNGSFEQTSAKPRIPYGEDHCMQYGHAPEQI
ncbi:MAG: hypothetical protein LBR42_01645 [Candidatus Methanoplasma sp.]|jgi:hypothetical protein|nr:hypothetical protein [Candidatus Methanoplasma sp.]